MIIIISPIHKRLNRPRLDKRVTTIKINTKITEKMPPFTYVYNKEDQEWT